MSEARPLRIVSIAHPAVSRAIGRRRYAPFADRPELDVHLVVPATWHEFGRVLTADPPDDPGVTVHVMPIRLPRAGPMGWYLHVYPGLRRLLRQLDPDVIHLWEEPWSLVALQASLLKRRAALVLEVDQNILKRLPPPFEAIRRHVLRHTAHLLSRSPDATQVCRARGYAGPVTMIGYGVDQDVFRPADAVAADPGGAPRPPGLRLGYVGRLIAEKGLDDALDAMARTSTPVSLVIVGEGPHEPALRARIAALGLGDRVTLRGWASPAEVARVMHGLDALILLTRTTGAVREQFGRVIVEAQSCGVPVIGSTCGAIPDVVGNGGWIVPERDPAALAALLDTIAGRPDERAARAIASRQNVLTRFTYKAVAEALATSWLSAAGRTIPREKIDIVGSDRRSPLSRSDIGNHAPTR
ncbi:MAG: glycosyltransferase [Rhodovulum sp.]|nr:glycosyltransferase [Rhodovulum sp.]